MSETDDHADPHVSPTDEPDAESPDDLGEGEPMLGDAEGELADDVTTPPNLAAAVNVAAVDRRR